MKLSVEIILIIIIGIIILFNACSETEYFYNVTGTTIAGADIDAIRNLNSYAKTLMQPNGTLTNPGNLTVSDKLEVLGGSKLVVQNNQDGGSGNGIYMWNKNDSNWGIYMSTPGDNKSLANGKACSSNNITGHAMRFRSYGGPNNGFIFENHSEQPVMAINSNTGDINFPNGWSISVSDGHFRIKHNGSDKFAVHNNGQPMYAPNGLDVGTWVGTGNGMLNVSGDIKTKKLNADLVDIKPATDYYKAGDEGVGLKLGSMRISSQTNDPMLITINSEATGTSAAQWFASTTNIGVDGNKRKGY